MQRQLEFDGGIAYGIDCLLTDPSLGGRCDSFFTVDFMVSPLFDPPSCKDTAQGPNLVLTETGATLAAALALPRLRPNTSSWLYLPHWLELRLRCATQCLKGTQQKSCIPNKQHTGQMVPVKSSLASSSLFQQQQYLTNISINLSKDGTSYHAFKLVQIHAINLFIQIAFTKFPVIKEHHCCPRCTGN